MLEVERGAAFLDTIDPYWWEKIDTDQLKMWSCSECVLGQLFGEFSVGIATLWATQRGMAGEYGFNISTLVYSLEDRSQRYTELRNAWIDLIAARRSMSIVAEEELALV